MESVEEKPTRDLQYTRGILHDVTFRGIGDCTDSYIRGGVLINEDKDEFLKHLARRRVNDAFAERLAKRIEEDKLILHKLTTTRPHILGKGCWCQPSIEQVQ